MKRKVLAIICTLSMICSFPAMAGPRLAKKISVYPVTGQKISVYSAMEKTATVQPVAQAVQSAQKDAVYPVAEQKAMFEKYGFSTLDGHSLLAVQIHPNTVKDLGNCYQAQATFLSGVELENVAPGVRQTVSVDDLKNEKKTFVATEDGFEEEGIQDPLGLFSYWTEKDGEHQFLYHDSHDRVDKPVFIGNIYIKKDAQTSIYLDNSHKKVTKASLNAQGNDYDGVFLDAQGYVTKLVDYGD